MTTEDARSIFLSFEGAREGEHMGHPDFRLKKGIFATLWPKKGTAVLRLPLAIGEALLDELPGSRMASRYGGMAWIEVRLDAMEPDRFAALAELGAEARR